MTVKYSIAVFVSVFGGFQCLAADDTARFTSADLCAILRAPGSFVGAAVRVEAEIVIDKEISILRPVSECTGIARRTEISWPEAVWLDSPVSAELPLPPNWISRPGALRAVEPIIERARELSLRYRVFGTIEGRVEARKHYLKVTRSDGSTAPHGFGYSRAYSAQIILGTFTRVRVVIDAADSQ
jgi:hypothetical protein